MKRLTQMRFALTTALFLAPALMGGGIAAHSHECSRYVQYVPEDSLENTYPVYVTIDEVNSGYMWSIWIYAESNGVQALQRDDDYCYTTDADGTPYTPETADTIIF